MATEASPGGGGRAPLGVVCPWCSDQSTPALPSYVSDPRKVAARPLQVTALGSSLPERHV